mmetsp:Transcript_22091/g.32887  ORF Transcript_22091/g.32887 Transcript_22091/m.32887 type:complete len:231 (-) Transcript_22091:796-1488(-)
MRKRKTTKMTKIRKKDKKGKKSKKDKATQNGGNHLEDAVFGSNDDKKDPPDDEDSVESEAGVDDAGALKLAVEGTKKYLIENPEASKKDIVEVVTNQQMASALKSDQKVHIFAQASITPQFYKNKEIEKYASVFSAITNENTIMERHLIAALEGISIEKPKNFPVMLKQLYDEDVLEEDTILEWASEGRTDFTLDAVDEDSRAALRGEAEPLINWLQDEDSEDDSDDESG